MTSVDAQLCAQAASDENQADIYLLNGPLVDRTLTETIRAVSEPTSAARAILLVASYGGQADAAYRIARWMQRFYSDFRVFPTSICASAGTLIVTGGDCVIMGPFSELGPLDVQKLAPNEIGQRKSGLVTRESLESLTEFTFSLFEQVMLNIKTRSEGNVSFDKSAEVASNITSHLMGKLYQQIDPETLGQNERDLRVAEEYGKRLSQYSKNISLGEIKHLVRGYPSHDFAIDVDEAKTIFQNVESPSSSLRELVLSLQERALKPNLEDIDVERLATYQEDTTSSSENGENGDDVRDASAEPTTEPGANHAQCAENGPTIEDNTGA